MSPICKICVHPKRKEIDKAIIKGATDRGIAKQYGGISDSGVNRHRSHVAKALVDAFERKQEKAGDELLDLTRELLQNAKEVYAVARKYLDERAPDKDGNTTGITPMELRAVGLAIGDQRELIETLGRLMGRIGGGTEVKIQSITLVQIAPVLYKVLARHPAALRELEAAIGSDAGGG
jgi:hypothetical protein